MPFATGEDFVSKCDRRLAASLCTSDDDSPVDPATVYDHPRVLGALQSATDLIKSVSAIANKYSDDDLQSLADAGDQFLVSLTCWLAMGELLGSRGVNKDQIPPYVERADQWVEKLRIGEKIFNLAGARDKGNVQTGAASTLQLRKAGLMTALAMGPFLPIPERDADARRGW